MHPFFSRFGRPGGHPHDVPFRAADDGEYSAERRCGRADRAGFFERLRAHHEHHHHQHHHRHPHHAGPRGPRGFDFFGGPRGGRGHGHGGDFDDPRGRGRGGRPLGHGDLRLLMLSLIAEQPRHGYEVIRLIEGLFHGAYSPSPGTIYPTLSQLEDMGLIAPTQEEGRKRYAITDEGRAHVEAEREDIEAALSRTHRSARDIAKAQIPVAVREQMQRLKRGLMTRHGRWSEQEIARVAALLQQAADAMENPEAR